MGTAAPGCPVERSSTSTAEKLLAPGVLKGHGFCGCGKTLGAESFERAWLQPCHPATNPTQAPQGPSLLAPQYSSTANDRASICPRIIWEGHGFSGCGPESFERAWLQPCHPPTSPTQAAQGPRFLASQYSSIANDRASICPRIIWEGHGFSGCGPESFERAWLQPCHPATSRRRPRRDQRAQ